MDRVDEVLASLKEERTRLRAELERVENAIASLESAGTVRQAAPRPYAMMNVYEATAHYLAEAGQPKTTREIAAALLAGGFKTRSARFASTIVTMLQRRETSSQYGIRRTTNKKRWFVRSESHK